MQLQLPRHVRQSLCRSCRLQRHCSADVALSIHAVMEAQIPHCRVDLPASEPVCTDAVTGLKFEHQFRRSGMLASTR